MVGYLVRENLKNSKIASAPEEVTESWAVKSFDQFPEKINLAKDHLEIIKYYLKDQPEMLKKLAGSFADIIIADAYASSNSG